MSEGFVTERAMRRYVRRIYVMIFALGLAIVIGLWIGVNEHDSRVRENTHAIALINDVARHADARAQAAFQRTITSERICSKSNHDGACRALFDRIRAAMTHKQRKTVGCDVLKVLAQNRDIRQLERASKCPR